MCQDAPLDAFLQNVFQRLETWRPVLGLHGFECFVWLAPIPGTTLNITYGRQCSVDASHLMIRTDHEKHFELDQLLYGNSGRIVLVLATPS